MLGEFRLYINGTLISSKHWHTRQARQLFKLLLLNRGHTLSARRLIDLLWPEAEDREIAYKTLRSAVSSLRAVLEMQRKPGESFRFVPRSSEAGYTLRFPPGSTVWIDVNEFERLMDQALTTQNVSEGTQLVEAALSLYTGDFLAEDEEASWTQAERTRLRDRYFSGVSRLMEWWLEAGRYNDAIALGRKALDVDACREPLYRLIMQCQAYLGDNAGALQTFEQCRQILDEQLGADPSPQTLQLHTAILQGTLHIEERPVAEKRTIGTGTQEPSVARASGTETSLSTLQRLRHSAAHGQQELSFVGRQAELQWLFQQLGDLKKVQLRRRIPGVIALVGEAGVGKTSLGRLFLDHASSEGIVTLATTCQTLEQGLPFATLTSLLRRWLHETSDEQLAELPRTILASVVPLLPELGIRLSGLSQPSTINPEQAYSLLISGLVELFATLCRSYPLILSFDDLQWADESSLLVISRLGYLLSSASSRAQVLPLLLLVSYRPEDVDENPPLAALLRDLRRGNALHVLNLARFTPTEVAAYLALHALEFPFSSEHLYQKTQGNALFLAEAVRTLQEHQEASSGISTGDSVTTSLLNSQHIHDVVLGRLTRLPQHAQDILELAAAIGRPFSLDLLRPELMDDDYAALDILLTRGFLIEISSLAPTREVSTYSTSPAADDFEVVLSFSHELVRQIVYATCSAPKLVRLHRSIAQNMERSYGTHLEGHAVELAFHYRMAGSQYRFHTLHYTVAAGDYALRTFNYRQALVHYTEAWQLVQHVTLSPPNQVAFDSKQWLDRIYHGRRLAYEALLDWEGVQESHRYLSTWAVRHEDVPLLSSSTHRMAITRSWMGNLSEAFEIGRALLERLRSEKDSLEQVQGSARKSVQILLDMTLRMTHVLILDGSERTQQHGDPSAIAPAQFPPFYVATSPIIQDLDEFIEILGTEQVVPILATYGLLLRLQGFNADAELCLKKTLKAAEESNHVLVWIQAALHLSRVYDYYGRQEEGTIWLQRSIERSQQLAEVPWITLWPLVSQAYRLIPDGRIDEAEQILSLLQARFAQQGTFLAQSYGIQVGLGLIALARGKLDQASELLHEALKHRHNLYLEIYVIAEVGLAQIAEQQEHYDEAYVRLQTMLAFCGQRSLLALYSFSSFAIARLLLHMSSLGRGNQGQLQAVAHLLSEVDQLVSGAGYVSFQAQCRELLRRVVAHSND
jgi:DNA-binding SARP family transcriptional activator